MTTFVPGTWARSTCLFLAKTTLTGQQVYIFELRFCNAEFHLIQVVLLSGPDKDE